MIGCDTGRGIYRMCNLPRDHSLISSSLARQKGTSPPIYAQNQILRKLHLKFWLAVTFTFVCQYYWKLRIFQNRTKWNLYICIFKMIVIFLQHICSFPFARQTICVSSFPSKSDRHTCIRSCSSRTCFIYKCATWPQRLAGYNNNIPLPHMKAVPVLILRTFLSWFCARPGRAGQLVTITFQFRTPKRTALKCGIEMLLL